MDATGLHTLTPYRRSLGVTNFNPDQTSWRAQTLISTRSRARVVLRTTTSVRSVASPEDFFGHDTRIMLPSGVTAER